MQSEYHAVRLQPGLGSEYHRTEAARTNQARIKQGENVEQAEANQIRFREVDQDGNPVDPAPVRPEDQPRSGRLGGPGRMSANPFIVILWLLAAILLTGGIWAFLEASATLGSGSNPMPLYFVLMNIAPWAVLSGALAVLALLFWHAAQWQQRRKQ